MSMFVSIIAQIHATWALLKRHQICWSGAKISVLVMIASPEHRRQILENFLSPKPERPLIVILGPTASGKTAFSISLAQELRKNWGETFEVVNADSRQFYKGFDIGTAKITSEQQQGIVHHLIDVLEPQEPCSISWYASEAKRVIAEIHARGHLPILVGGSMLYMSALVDGLEPLPPADAALRERLGREYDADHGKTLFARLTAIDPETAASFPMQNKIYVVRAMEIFESTGKTKSSQKKSTGGEFDALLFGMDIERDVLHQKIAARTRLMLEQGWIDEVRRLKSQGVRMSDPAMKSVGYREIFAFLESCGEQGLVAEHEIKDLSEIIQSHTRAYAKRHMTWWKKDPRVHWIKT